MILDGEKVTKFHVLKSLMFSFLGAEASAVA
jgi:hypothetical protein